MALPFVFRTAPAGRDMTLGILGLGRIGKRMAHVSRCSGVSWPAIPYIIDGDFPAYIRSAATWPVFSARPTSYAPLRSPPRTPGMIGATVLAGRQEFLVNTARGAVVDVDAALEALDAGTLAGLGLDVLPVEPVPERARSVRGTPRVILTPHAAAVLFGGRGSSAQGGTEHR